VGKADELSTAVSQRATQLTEILDDKSSVLLAALNSKSAEFSGELSRLTEHAVKAIEVKGLAFTQTMMDNSEQIARLINEASETATGSVNESIKQMQTTTQGASQAVATSVNQSIQQVQTTAAEASQATTSAINQSIKELQNNSLEVSRNAAATVQRTLRDLQEQTHSAVEHSKQTAAAAVSEMLETHGMLRSDTTALFERLREANILLQEVLSGAHENISEIERTLLNRVSEFVAAMNDVTQKTGAVNTQVTEHIASFQSLSAKTVGDLGQLAGQFDAHGRSLAEAVALIDQSNRRAEGTIGDRRELLETLVSMLDSKSSDLDQRLTRFSGLLDQSLDGAAERAREIARIIADSTTGGARAIAENFEVIRENTEQQSKRTTDTLRSIYERASGDSHAMFNEAAQRFAEVVDGLKGMTAEMQRELDSTRAALRKGILELPQETSESAAQMRRVIVDQIEALAELNRIVARHGRGLDTADPTPRRAEPIAVAAAPAPRRMGREEQVHTNGGGRAEPPPRGRADITGMTPPPPVRRTELPSAGLGQGPAGGAAQAQGGRSGWLSDLLTRASREEEAPREAVDAMRGGDDRPPRHTIESLDSLAVDIARMIDHDAAAELWERYNRGERNVFTRKLYTMQGQRAFEEIRRKYRGDREFMQTVDRYIGEFERLLDEVSRDDRGQVVARTYLTSETGKVYTMLAHAAGRFD
jgi:hypothetical protein